MIENWNDVHIVPEFSDQGVDCYRLAGGSFVNEYYIVSEAETRKLITIRRLSATRCMRRS